MNLNNIFNNLQKVAVKNSPTILVGLGVASLVTCVYLTIKATPKSQETWVAKEHEVGDEILYHSDGVGTNLREAVSKPEYAKILLKDFAPIWAPTVIAGAASIGFFIGANHIHVKRQEMLVAAYTIGEKALSTYQKKVIETVGEKKHLEVMDGIASDKTKENPYNPSTVITTAYGDTRFYDEWSGRYFLSDINSVRKAENEIIKRLPVEMTLCVNDYYEELGLPPIKSGSIVGWDVNDILLDVNYSPIFDSKGHPCTAISYLVGVLESKNYVL